MNWVELEAIGTWVAALGTIAAVATALYLSIYQNKQKLRVVAGDGYYIETSADFTVTITNIGFRPVVIQELKWVMTNYPKEDRVVINEDQLLVDENNPPPRRLIEGETLRLTLDLHHLRSIIATFGFIHDMNVEPDYLRGLKLSIVTAKENIEVAVESDMLQALMKIAEKENPSVKNS